MRALTGLLVVLTIASAAGAQTFRGGINGIVTDQTGAILPGADVKATNDATGLSYSTTSSTAGAFTFADLPLGDYTIVVSESGFETITIRGVRVSAGAIYTVSVRLNVAQIEANVQVSAAAVAVETTSTTLTNVLSTRTVQDLPLNGRDFSQMLALTPGFSGYEGGGAASMNGSRSNQFNWQIEGTDNNDQWFNIKAVNQGGINSIPGVLLPLDSVEEYSVQTQASAETGRNPGGAVNLIIKSGTNQPRGSAYYYNRNEALAALSPFAPTDSPKNKLRNEHYGFSLGGPIERDKTFFFTTYEHQNFVIGNQALATMPSAAYQAAAMQLLQQYSVPVNSVSRTLLNTLWPADTLTGAASSNNYFNPTPQTGYSHNFLVKVDHSLNNDHRLSFRAFFGRGSQTAPVGSLISDYFQVGPMRVQNYSAVHNAVLGSSLTNQLLVGVNYFNQTFSDANSSFDPVRLGFNTGVSGTDLAGAPFLSITGFDPTGVSPNSGRTDVITHVSDALSYTKGKHEMRFGGEIRRVGIEEFGAGGGNNDGGRGNFFFNGTQGPWSGLLSVTGYDTNIAALADFLAGSVYQSTILSGDVRRHVDQNLANLFAQDSWRLNRQLNINLGGDQRAGSAASAVSARAAHAGVVSVRAAEQALDAGDRAVVVQRRDRRGSEPRGIEACLPDYEERLHHRARPGDLSGEHLAFREQRDQSVFGQSGLQAGARDELQRERRKDAGTERDRADRIRGLEGAASQHRARHQPGGDGERLRQRDERGRVYVSTADAAVLRAVPELRRDRSARERRHLQLQLIAGDAAHAKLARRHLAALLHAGAQLGRGVQRHLAASGQQQPDGRLQQRRIGHPSPRWRLSAL